MALPAWVLGEHKFLGITWDVWKVIGWAGNGIFFSRFFVQWIATEKRKQVTVPISFWWISLIGSVLLLVYGIHQRDSVFIFAYAFTWIPYIRNIVIYYRNKAAERHCASCTAKVGKQANFCHQCGTKLDPAASAARA